MKKNQLLLLVLVLVIFTSCKKESVTNPYAPKYVEAIDGQFIAKEGDITFKSSPVGQTRTWTMYAKNSTFYGDVAFAPVKGDEFITGSAAYNFWHTDGNNPVTFPASQGVYSNLTPNEDLRIITETKDAHGNVAYLGMLDFTPAKAGFPLAIHAYRLGDVLQINTNALTSLPGGKNLIITVAYNLATIDLAATKVGALSGTGSGAPNGNEFIWADVHYGVSVPAAIATVPKGTKDYNLYDGLGSKVTGSIVITITNPENGGSKITLPAIEAKSAGNGMKLILKTSKAGRYNSNTNGFKDTDITVVSEDATVF